MLFSLAAFDPLALTPAFAPPRLVLPPLAFAPTLVGAPVVLIFVNLALKLIEAAALCLKLVEGLILELPGYVYKAKPSKFTRIQIVRQM